MIFKAKQKNKQEAHGPQCSPELTAPRGLIGRIYVGDHYTLLHTKYISCGPHGFREEDFSKFFPIISPWELMTPRAWPVLGLIGRIYVGDH